MRVLTREETGVVGRRLRVCIRWEKKLPEPVGISSFIHMTSGELTNER